MSDALPGQAQQSIRRHSLVGALVLLLLAGGVGGWAATTEIAGAVVASGVLVVDTNVKKVQHPTGGVVGKLLVQNGSPVKAGDVVVRLEDTVTRANLAIVVKGLDELAARAGRLESERDGAEAMRTSEELALRLDTPEIARLVEGERTLFAFRKMARQGQKSQLRERVSQLGEQIQGLLGQAAAKKREIGLIERELEGVRDLWEKNLVPLSRVTELERAAARLDGERNQLVASVAEAKGKITETELQIIQIDQDLRSDVAKELREIQAKSAELVERRVAAEDQLKRIDIRAPQDGVVHELTVHTLGGVVAPGDQIMLIVPDHDVLTVEVKVSPHDIDQLWIGQTAALRFSSFNVHITPEISGVVTRVSADITQDAKTGLSYYLVRINPNVEEMARLGKMRLVPGMPVDIYVQTRKRTVLSYFLKPLSDQVARAFREE